MPALVADLMTQLSCGLTTSCLFIKRNNYNVLKKSAFMAVIFALANASSNPGAQDNGEEFNGTNWQKTPNGYSKREEKNDEEEPTRGKPANHKNDSKNAKYKKLVKESEILRKELFKYKEIEAREQAKRAEEQREKQKAEIERQKAVEQAIICLRCNTHIPQDYIKRSCVRNLCIRERAEHNADRAEGETTAQWLLRNAQFGKGRKEPVPFKNDDVEALRKEYEKNGEFEKINAESIKYECHRGFDFGPKIEKGHRGFKKCKDSKYIWAKTNNWYTGFMYERQDYKRETIECPHCKFIMVAKKKNGLWTVTKKGLDANWKLGVVFSSLLMGIGFAVNSVALRNGEDIGSQWGGHFWFIIGAYILFYFLFRGNGFFDGNHMALAFKSFGLASGMVGTFCFVNAMSNVSPVSDGSDIDMKELLGSDTTVSFKLSVTFWLLAFLMVIWVNYKHNEHVQYENFYNSPYAKGLYNFLLFGAVAGGTASITDIFCRISQPDESMVVGAGSFLLSGFCVSYIMLYSLFNFWEDAKELRPFMVGATLMFVGCCSAFVHCTQDGINTKIVDDVIVEPGTGYGAIVSMIGICASVTWLIFIVLKAKGANFNVCKDKNEI